MTGKFVSSAEVRRDEGDNPLAARQPGAAQIPCREELPPRRLKATPAQGGAESPSDTATDRQVIADCAEKLTTAMVSPALLTLEELSALDHYLRAIEDLEDRKAWARRISEICRGRWNRLDPDLRNVVDQAFFQVGSAPDPARAFPISCSRR